MMANATIACSSLKGNDTAHCDGPPPPSPRTRPCCWNAVGAQELTAPPTAAVVPVVYAGWFLIDFVSVLPIQYAMLIINANNPADEGDSVSSIKIAKILR